MALNFSDDFYMKQALKSKVSVQNSHNSTDAFFLLINGLEMEDLSNLCSMIRDYYTSLPNPIYLSLKDCYKLTQNMNLNEVEKKTIEELAAKCIREGKRLGEKTVNNGKINTSSWINHCYYASEVCAILAEQLNLDVDTAKSMGMLHDYGRKFIHSFNHTIEGFETLNKLGWENEAIGCLTHSFVNGERCCNNEPALENFYIDNNGDPQWAKNVVKDDMTLFLENYEFTDYDVLLTVADLMATSSGIVSPKDRIEDIATRRTIDPTNRGYFLASATNTFISILQKMNLLDNNVKFIKDDENTSFEQITEYFNVVSNYFFNVFSNLPQKQNKNQI